MPVYTEILNSEIDQDSPVTQPLMTALRDNPLAIAEGDATAPQIQTAALIASERMTTANVLAQTAGASAGAVGTYMLGTNDDNTNRTLAFGATIAGSSLEPVGIQSDGSNPVADFTAVTGSARSGTWRVMGQFVQSIVERRIITLFLRIS